MKIGIDARLYGTKHRGIGRYSAKLIEHLEKIDTVNEYIIFMHPDNYDEYIVKNSNFKKVKANFRAYSWKEQLLFPKLISRHNLDFVHFTHFNVPLLFNGRYIVTIHDLIISHYPNSRATTLNPALYKLKLFFYNIVVKRAAKRASKIIAISNYTKQDIIKYLKVGPEKISTVYEGLGADNSSACSNDKYLEGLGINGDYLLYVGAAYPHKNLELLVGAFKVVTQAQQDIKLVLVGKIDFFYQRLQKLVSRLGLENRVIFTDFVGDDELDCLYDSAKYFIFPSLIEGFGLPPLEAQLRSVPVISSNSTCLPEVLDDSAIFFDPNSESNMSSVIAKALNSEKLRVDLISRGKSNSARYSWQDCAKSTSELYNDLKAGD